MPAFFPSYTNCSAPSQWSGIPIAALSVLGGLGIVGLLAAGLAGAWAPGAAAFMAMVCLAAITFCSWWLDTRLICLGGDRSTIGVIYHLEPPDPTDDAFGFGSYDTDFSFNLLIWPFVPQDTIPQSFVTKQWTAGEFAALGAGEWTTDFPTIPFAEVQDLVNLIVPQQTMAGVDGGSNLTFVGQDVDAVDEAVTPPVWGSTQHFLQHCEIEGPGMHDLRILLWVLFGVYVAAAAVSAIPVIGTALSVILSILAFLAFLFGGAAITHSDASPPDSGGFGGTFHNYDAADDPSTPVDLAYCFGRWVYDSLHKGWNELHPLHFMIKIGQTTKGAIAGGNWPTDLGATKTKLDGQFATINTVSSRATQKQPENQWQVHPMLDGCQGSVAYPPIG